MKDFGWVGSSRPLGARESVLPGLTPLLLSLTVAWFAARGWGSSWSLMVPESYNAVAPTIWKEWIPFFWVSVKKRILGRILTGWVCVKYPSLGWRTESCENMDFSIRTTKLWDKMCAGEGSDLEKSIQC